MGKSMPAADDDDWRLSDVAVRLGASPCDWGRRRATGGVAVRLGASPWEGESTDRWTADPRIGGPAATAAPTGSMHDDDTADAGSHGDRRGRTGGDRARSREAVRRAAGAGRAGPRRAARRMFRAARPQRGGQD